MAGPLQIEGAQSAPSDYAPLHINRMVTGFWTNTNPLRDAATDLFTEKFYGGRQDRIAAGRNAEVSSKLTLRRRPGLSVFNSQIFPLIMRFYGWNTFTLTNEAVRLMADTATAVYDATGPDTKTLIWTKTMGSGPTFFLGVGNILYFTNGVENKQLNNATGIVSDWGIQAPVDAPTVTQTARPNPYPTWQADTCYSTNDVFGLAIEDGNNNIQRVTTFGVTGAMEPSPWNTTIYGATPDNTVMWQNMGPSGWTTGHNYVYGDPIVGRALDPVSGLMIGQLFWCIHAGTSGALEPHWLAGTGTLINDNGVTWKNAGNLLYWSTDIGASCPIVSTATILDPNGYLQTILQAGKSGSFASVPDWQTEPGAYTNDGGITWLNSGNFASGTTDPWRYGYAYKNSVGDISNMSPPSDAISVARGGEVIVQGAGTGDPQVATIVLYRTVQGGSTFFLLDEIPNPGAGATWTYTDTHPDSDLTIEIQAQVGGEGTPLPIGATCLEYHVGRIFAAVGNVVYVSSGPDAIVSGSSGNAGFDITFTAQSKITRFWVSSLGVVVFTVRDAYIILGSGTNADPLYMVKYIENLPLLNYDAFAIFLTTPYLLTGHRMVNALDPSAGIVEASFPIADEIAAIDPRTAYVTFHNGPSGETALYVANSQRWYRMAPTSAPEHGLNWNPPAFVTNGTSAVQSVETAPGQMTLLIGPPGFSHGPILMRDTSVNTDNGITYPAFADLGNIVLAHTGQLAGLAWIALESEAIGTPTQVSIMLDETEEKTGSNSARFFPVPRTRQDPPNLPPSETIFSNRHSLLQDQKPVWCKSLKLRLEWPAEDAANELDTFAIFGQVWAEQRSQ
jgi:hypothetical protein